MHGPYTTSQLAPCPEKSAYRNVGDLPKPQLPIMAFIGRYPAWVGESLSPMVTGQRFASTQLDRWGSHFDLLFSEWKAETR